jgi:hypothetical protein
MKFSTFTLPTDYSWFVSDPVEMHEMSPDLINNGPMVERIPPALLQQLVLIQIDKSLGLGDAMEYAAKVLEEHYKP